MDEDIHQDDRPNSEISIEQLQADLDKHERLEARGRGL